MNDDFELGYLERGPREPGTPLIILLHGWAMYKDHLFEMTRGWDERWAIVAPQAPVRMGPGANRWFDFERTPDAGPIINDEEECSSLEKLQRFVARLVEARKPSSVYVVGHSQGGTMSLSLALSRPLRLAGVAQINGRFLKKRLEGVAATQLQGMSMFFGHGTENPIVPIRLGRWTGERAASLGAKVVHEEYPIGHEVTPEYLRAAALWLDEQISRRIKRLADGTDV